MVRALSCLKLAHHVKMKGHPADYVIFCFRKSFIKLPKGSQAICRLHKGRVPPSVGYSLHYTNLY